MKFKLRLRFDGAVLGVAIRRIESPRVQNPVWPETVNGAGAVPRAAPFFYSKSIHELVAQRHIPVMTAGNRAAKIGNSSTTPVD
jgi:hypothetical protein